MSHKAAILGQFAACRERARQHPRSDAGLREFMWGEYQRSDTQQAKDRAIFAAVGRWPVSRSRAEREWDLVSGAQLLLGSEWVQ